MGEGEIAGSEIEQRAGLRPEQQVEGTREFADESFHVRRSEHARRWVLPGREVEEQAEGSDRFGRGQAGELFQLFPGKLSRPRRVPTAERERQCLFEGLRPRRGGDRVAYLSQGDWKSSRLDKAA